MKAGPETGVETMLHDAKRTTASYIAMFITNAETADRVLNYALSGIMSRYGFHEFPYAKIHALVKWNHKLNEIVE